MGDWALREAVRGLAWGMCALLVAPLVLAQPGPDAAEDPSAEVGDETAEKPTADATEEPPEEADAEPAEDAAEEAADQSAEDATEETSDQPADEADEDTAEDAAEDGQAEGDGDGDGDGDDDGDVETATEESQADDTDAATATDGAPASCDPKEYDCAPCKPPPKKKKKGEAKPQGPCCDPEASDLCVDMSPKFVGMPVPMYNPQLEFSLGVLGLATYHPIKNDKKSPPWSTMVFGMYTTNDSWLAAAMQEAYWHEDDNRAHLAIGTGKFNSDFYGTGSTADLGFSLPLGSAMFFLQPQYMRRVWNRLYVGARYRLIWNEATLYPPDVENVPPAWVPISTEMVLSGVGLVSEYDSRDSRFSPTEGWYVPLGSIFYAEALGSDQNFANMDLAVNYYHSWFNRSLILASRGFFTIATDDTPAHMKPAVGMQADLRGYAYGRYRDNVFMAAQVEARWYFWWKLGAVAWTGIGTTTSGLDHLGDGTVLPSYGLGLRFLAFEEQRLVLRMDYGRGNEDGQFYFSVSEAF